MDNSEIEQEEVKIYDFKNKTWRDDVTFLVEDQRFYASKAILAIDSPVFEAMFGTSFKEREETEIPLPGKKPEDFNEFLQCIYPRSQKKINADNVYKILPLADEYDVRSLVRKCQQYLSSYLTDNRASTDEVIFCHVLATRYKFQDLRDFCANRLSDIGLKDIPSASCNDTDALLELHKDILMKQGESLDKTRTELVDMYMNKDLSIETVSTRDLSNIKGAIIKFKPCLDFAKQDRKVSNSVTLWNIKFEVIVKLTKRENVDYFEVFLKSTFPETDEILACVIDAKFQIKRAEECRPHICFSFNEREFSNKDSKYSYGFRQTLMELSLHSYIVDKQVDLVVYFMVKKPFVKDQ